jgi:hypothetical protein
MARRLTTNQEIAGSIPAVVTHVLFFIFFHTIVTTFADRLVANNILLVVTVMELKYFTRSPVKS